MEQTTAKHRNKQTIDFTNQKTRTKHRAKNLFATNKDSDISAPYNFNMAVAGEGEDDDPDPSDSRTDIFRICVPADATPYIKIPQLPQHTWATRRATPIWWRISWWGRVELVHGLRGCLHGDRADCRLTF